MNDLLCEEQEIIIVEPVGRVTEGRVSLALLCKVEAAF